MLCLGQIVLNKIALGGSRCCNLLGSYICVIDQLQQSYEMDFVAMLEYSFDLEYFVITVIGVFNRSYFLPVIQFGGMKLLIAQYFLL